MILCLDLETTALSEIDGAIVEIGAVWLDGTDEFFRQCRPRETALLDPRALEVNGWSAERAKDVRITPEAVAVVEFLGWVRGSTLRSEPVQIAAWNGHFDHRHLHAALSRAGVDDRFRPFSHRILDLHSLLAGDLLRARVKEGAALADLGNELKSADEASRLLGLTPEPKPHHGLAGARQVRSMLRHFLGDLESVA